MTRPPLGISARATIKNVVDGDTVDVELRIPARVRMVGAYAPESRTKDASEKVKGLAAKTHLTELAEGKHGQVFIDTSAARSLTDVLTLDRLVGTVWIDGMDVDLSTAQVMAGHASSTKGGGLGL